MPISGSYVRPNTSNFLRSDPRGTSGGMPTGGSIKAGQPGDAANIGNLGYSDTRAFGPNVAPSSNKSPTYREGKQKKGTATASWDQMTADERDKYRVSHGIAPTAADPSKRGVATRAAAKAANAQGKLSKKEIKAEKVVKGREIDEAKYSAGVKAAKTAAARAKAEAEAKAKKDKLFGGARGSKAMKKSSSRTLPNRGDEFAVATAAQARALKAGSSVGFAGANFGSQDRGEYKGTLGYQNYDYQTSKDSQAVQRGTSTPGLFHIPGSGPYNTIGGGTPYVSSSEFAAGVRPSDKAKPKYDPKTDKPSTATNVMGYGNY